MGVIVQFQLYLKRRGKWRQVLDVAASLGIPYVVEVGPLDTSRSPITTALELGDVSPEALVLPRDAVDKFEWYIMLADALDVKRLVVAPPPTVEGVAELYDVAVEYGVEVNWIYGEGPLARIRDVDAVAKAIRPTAARLVYDPVKAKGLKEIYTTIIALSGYIREIYLSNRRGERAPATPIRPRGHNQLRRGSPNAPPHTVGGQSHREDSPPVRWRARPTAENRQRGNKHGEERGSLPQGAEESGTDLRRTDGVVAQSI